MIDEYLNRMEEEASTTGSLAEAAVEKSLAELDLAANPVNPGLTQPRLKMAPRPGPMVGGMGEVRGDLRFGLLIPSGGSKFIQNVGQNLFLKPSQSICSLSSTCLVLCSFENQKCNLNFMAVIWSNLLKLNVRTILLLHLTCSNAIILAGYSPHLYFTKQQLQLHHRQHLDQDAHSQGPRPRGGRGRSVDFPLRLLVASDMVGAIIGRGGATIR